MRALIAALIATTLISVPARAQEKETCSKLLLKWEHTQRITLDMEKALPGALFKEIERQSGVKIEDGTRDEPPATLKVKNVPVWQALAEASAACKTGLELGDSAGLDRGSRSVSFHGTAWSPAESRPRVFDRYQVLGPFLIGMCRSPVLPLENSNKQPGMFVRVLSFPTEAGVWTDNDGTQELSLFLRDEKGKKWPLQPARAPDALKYLDRVHVLIPAGLEKQKVDLCGSFGASVYLAPKEFVIPITRPQVKKFDEFGGLSIRVVKTPSKRSPSAEVELDWNLNLNEADARIYKKYAEKERNESLTPDEAVEAVKWIKSKRDEIRLLGITYFAARDKDANVVRPVYSGNDGDRLELHFPMGQQPVDLRCAWPNANKSQLFLNSRMFFPNSRPLGKTISHGAPGRN